MSAVFEWFRSHPGISGTLLGVSMLLFVAGIVLAPIALTRMPADYFMREHQPLERWETLHPTRRRILIVLKNVFGAVLVLAGLAMLVLPGQGLVTIFVGTTLLDFPGKRRLELWLVRRRPVLLAINWIRRRGKRPKLRLPDR